MQVKRRTKHKMNNGIYIEQELEALTNYRLNESRPALLQKEFQGISIDKELTKGKKREIYIDKKCFYRSSYW